MGPTSTKCSTCGNTWIAISKGILVCPSCLHKENARLRAQPDERTAEIERLRKILKATEDVLSWYEDEMERHEKDWGELPFELREAENALDAAKENRQ